MVKRGKRVETQNCQVSGFSHNFCHGLSEKKRKNLKCGIFQMLVLSQIEAMQLPNVSL